jgi:tRNA G18 (ribose-2'-O)-methylase SpoU
MHTSYRCPRPDCRHLFTDPAAEPGRVIRCSACSREMNARPGSMDRILKERERTSPGGAGAGLTRLPLAVLVDNVRSLWNVGSIFRTSDACGVGLVALAGITGAPPRDAVAKTALGAEQAVAWRYRAEALTALTEIVREGYTPVALETGGGGCSLRDYCWPEQPCLVVGNEIRGISPEVLDACTLNVSIPMRGVKDSLNVAVAFGIAVHHAAGQLADRG